MLDKPQGRQDIILDDLGSRFRQDGRRDGRPVKPCGQETIGRVGLAE
jgi:hypothetical protein